jgi:hypothetical protein
MFSIIDSIYSWQLYPVLRLLFSSITGIFYSLPRILGFQTNKFAAEGDPESGYDPPNRSDVSFTSAACSSLLTSPTKRISQSSTTADKATSPELLEYSPNVEEVLGFGSTSIVGRLKPGVVLKSPRFSWWESTNSEVYDIVKRVKRNFSVEERILQILGPHPNVIRYG